MYHVLLPIWYQFVPDAMDYYIYLLPPIFESHSLFLILTVHFHFLPSVLNLITYSWSMQFFRACYHLFLSLTAFFTSYLLFYLFTSIFYVLACILLLAICFWALKSRFDYHSQSFVSPPHILYLYDILIRCNAFLLDFLCFVVLDIYIFSMQNGTKLIMDDLFREQMLKNVSLDDLASFIMVSGQDWNK